MNPYYVISPEYGSGGGYCEPPESGCDCIEVEAETPREALRLGVRLALAQRNSWAQNQKDSDANPFAGYRVEDARCHHGYPYFVLVSGKSVYQRCWGCAALAAAEDAA